LDDISTHKTAGAGAVAERTRQLRWPALLALGCAAVIAGYRLLVALRPSLGDAALFFYFGRRMNEGATLYVDIWDLKPPVIFLVNAVAARFGDPFMAIAFVETITLLAGAALLARALYSIGAWHPSIAAALIFYALLVSFNSVAEGANYTEIYVIPFATLSVLLFVQALERQGRSGLRFAGAGAAACLAASAKLPGLSPLLAELAFLAAMLLVPGRRTAAAAAIAWCLAGFLACLAAILALGALFTDLRLLIDGSLLHPINYARQPVAGSGHNLADQALVLSALAMPLLSTLLAAMVAAIAFAGAARSQLGGDLVIPRLRLQQYCGLFALWAFADLAGALGTGRNYGHYFLPLAASDAAASAALLSWARLKAPRAALLLLALFGASLCLPAFNAARTARWTIQLRPPGAEAAVPEIQRPILAALRARAGPGDTLAVWDNMHALYLQSGLRNATPHLALLNGADSDYAARTKAPAILDHLRRCPATFIVMPTAPQSFSPAAASFDEQIRMLLVRSYEPVPLPAGGSYELHQRRDEAGPGCARG
jgi:hypothetical protein